MRYVRDLLRANKGEEVVEILYPLSVYMIRGRMPNFSLDKWYKTASSLTVERISKLPLSIVPQTRNDLGGTHTEYTLVYEAWLYFDLWYSPYK